MRVGCVLFWSYAGAHINMAHQAGANLQPVLAVLVGFGDDSGRTFLWFLLDNDNT
jgi:hypothetical protein